VPLPDDPVLEVLPEDDPLLPEDPALEVLVPVLEVPLPDGPLRAGTEGMVPTPQPARKQMANNRPDILSMKISLFAARMGALANALARWGALMTSQ
jgi:hypothetical protein